MKRGRKVDPIKGKRNKFLTIRVTESEYAHYVKAAKEREIEQSQLLRTALNHYLSSAVA